MKVVGRGYVRGGEFFGRDMGIVGFGVFLLLIWVIFLMFICKVFVLGYRLVEYLCVEKVSFGGVLVLVL